MLPSVLMLEVISTGHLYLLKVILLSLFAHLLSWAIALILYRLFCKILQLKKYGRHGQTDAIQNKHRS